MNLLAAFVLLGTSLTAGETVERRVPLMGTTLQIRIEARSREEALAASERALHALEATEARLSTWRDSSELARLNAAAAEAPFPLSQEFELELRQALWCAEVTGGAFNPAIGALLAAWDLRGPGRIPNRDELAAALQASQLRDLELGPGSAVRHHAGLRLDEGGFGKGAGLDRALVALEGEARGIRALFDFGGQVAVFGGAQHIAIADPRERGRAVLELELAGGSASTTGNGEAGRLLGGRRVGHVFDPQSGEPAEDFGSVTVLAASALTADCLSTGLFVLGPERTLALAEVMAGIEVVVIRVEENGLEVRSSAGLEGRLRALTPDVHILGAATDRTRQDH